MELYQWPNYNQYVQAQIKGSRRRFHRRPLANDREFDRMAGWLHKANRVPESAVCHGARCGTEVALLKRRFPEAEVIGTDLSPIDEVNVVKADFHEDRPEWRGKFGLVYSNSLDHSLKPLECLQTWFGQLNDPGVLCLTWTFLHTLEDGPLPRPGGDCFGANLHEYLSMCNKAGRVLDLLWVDMGHGQVVIVAERR